LEEEGGNEPKGHEPGVKGGIAMSVSVWDHWGWPLATAVIGFVFAGLLVRQYLQRRKPHQLAWAVGFLMYAAAAAMESYSGYVDGWDPTVYRVYIVLAASLVGFLGLGTVYLVLRRPVWGHAYLVFNLVFLALFLYGAFTVTLVPDSLVAGISVGGKPLGAPLSFPRAYGFFFNIPGTVALLGGSAYSILKFIRKPEYRYRAWANVWIILGTLVIAGAGSMARTGRTVGLYPAEMAGAALLLIGFLQASTLEKGARAIRQRRRAAAV